MANVYYDPEKFGLTTVGEIEWSDGCYQFDLTVVWRTADGRLVYGEDSGCSWPGIFEDDPGVEDLTATTPAELQIHLEERNRDNYSGDRSGPIAELMAAVTK